MTAPHCYYTFIYGFYLDRVGPLVMDRRHGELLLAFSANVSHQDRPAGRQEK